MEKNKWYKVGEAEPPLGEFVVLAARVLGTRRWVQAMYAGGGQFLDFSTGVQRAGTHFMILSDPQES